MFRPLLGHLELYHLCNIRIMFQAYEFYILFNVLENIWSFYFLYFYHICVNIVFPAWERRQNYSCLDSVTDLVNALPGNSSVNTVQHATIEEAMFSVDPTDAPVDCLDSDHVIYIYCRSLSIPRLYKQGTIRAGQLWVTSE
jgi:hypothetical protein